MSLDSRNACDEIAIARLREPLTVPRKTLCVFCVGSQMGTGGNFLFNTYCTGVAIKTQPRCFPASAVCYHPTRHVPDTAPP